MIKFSSFLLLFLLFSCGSITPDAPAVHTHPVPLLKQPISTIIVPIKINLTPYFKETDKSIPKKFSGKEENCEGVSFSYVFYRDPISFKGKGNTLDFDVDGKYALSINYCPSCTDYFDKKGTCLTPRVYANCGGNGESMRRIEIGYSTKIELSPEFQLKAKTSLRKVQPVDPCEITVFKYDATATLKTEITKALKGLEKQIDKEIGSVDLKSEAKKAWKLLEQPISLGKYGFLTAYPSGIGFDNLYFKENLASAELALQLQPQLTSIAPTIKASNLPKLSEINSPSGFNINLDLVANYDSISAVLTKELKGKNVEIKGKKIVFEDISIFGASDQQVSLKIGFTGNKTGVLYLMGTPHFDPSKQLISFPDIAFDLETKNALLKSAKWLFDSKITDALRRYSTIDLTAHLQTIKQTLEKQLNTELQKGIYLRGSIKEIGLDGIYPTAEAFTLRIHSTGSVKLDL